jgi:PAS domain S-box-containing protein
MSRITPAYIPHQDSLIETTDSPTWIFDALTLAMLDVNDAAITNYGYSREQFLSLTILDIRPVEDIQPLLHQVFNPNHKSPSGGELWKHRRKDGTIFAVRVSSHELTFKGRPAKMVSAVPVCIKSKRTIPLNRAVAVEFTLSH